MLAVVESPRVPMACQKLTAQALSAAMAKFNVTCREGRAGRPAIQPRPYRLAENAAPRAVAGVRCRAGRVDRAGGTRASRQSRPSRFSNEPRGIVPPNTSIVADRRCRRSKPRAGQKSICSCRCRPSAPAMTAKPHAALRSEMPRSSGSTLRADGVRKGPKPADAQVPHSNAEPGNWWSPPRWSRPRRSRSYAD